MITIDGVDYTSGQLDSETKYLVNQIQLLQQKSNNLSMELDQVEVAKVVFQSKLKAKVQELKDNLTTN